MSLRIVLWHTLLAYKERKRPAALHLAQKGWEPPLRATGRIPSQHPPRPAKHSGIVRPLPHLAMLASPSRPSDSPSPPNVFFKSANVRTV